VGYMLMCYSFFQDPPSYLITYASVRSSKKCRCMTGI